MNEKIDLKKILKDCPKGTKFYSTIFGEVEFKKIKEDSNYPIIFVSTDGNSFDVTADGRYYNWDGECTLFPSKDQRDWSKFTAPWLKNGKFDPKTLKPFDKVLVSSGGEYIWMCDFFSYIEAEDKYCNYWCVGGYFEYCIPYNEETKHLVGTNEEAPEYYKYWED